MNTTEKILSLLFTGGATVALFGDSIEWFAGELSAILLLTIRIALAIGLVSFSLLLIQRYRQNASQQAINAKQAEFEAKLQAIQLISAENEARTKARLVATVRAGETLYTNCAELYGYQGQALPHRQPKMLDVAAERDTVRQPIRKLDVVSILENSPHIAIMGATGQGKSTLAIEFANRIVEPLPSAKIAIVDTHQSEWPYPVTVTRLEDIPPFFEGVLAEIEKDKEAKNRNGAPKVIICDEHDENFDELRDKYISPFKRTSKTGRKFGYRIIACGQSPLSKDNGLSQSAWKNFTRIVMGNEAMSFLQSGQFTWRDLKPALLSDLESLIASGKRGALVLPMSLPPYVAEIPELRQPEARFHPEALWLPKPPIDERAELARQLYAEGLSLSKISIRIFGSKGGSQVALIKEWLNGSLVTPE